MKSSMCFNAKAQYYANITLKINVKLGGINLIPDPQNASFLADPVNPTMVMGADITHPPGNRRRPSFTSLVGSIDANAVKYASTRMSVQSSPREVIEDDSIEYDTPCLAYIPCFPRCFRQLLTRW
jgi:eukaryotic translation initiation factor 2C